MEILSAIFIEFKEVFFDGFKYKDAVKGLEIILSKPSKV